MADSTQIKQTIEHDLGNRRVVETTRTQQLCSSWRSSDTDKMATVMESRVGGLATSEPGSSFSDRAAAASIGTAMGRVTRGA
jgi:hypothetical protein